LFSKGQKITFSIEFVYKEVTSNSTTAKGKKKKKNATGQMLKGFREPLTLVFGLESMSISVAEPNTVRKDPTA
jgi:hypothetical protein